MEYVDKQIFVMQKHNSMIPLTPQQYYRLVDQVEKVGKELWLSSGGEIV